MWEINKDPIWVRVCRLQHLSNYGFGAGRFTGWRRGCTYAEISHCGCGLCAMKRSRGMEDGGGQKIYGAGSCWNNTWEPEDMGWMISSGLFTITKIWHLKVSYHWNGSPHTVCWRRGRTVQVQRPGLSKPVPDLQGTIWSHRLSGAVFLRCQRSQHLGHTQPLGSAAGEYCSFLIVPLDFWTADQQTWATVNTSLEFNSNKALKCLHSITNACHCLFTTALTHLECSSLHLYHLQKKAHACPSRVKPPFERETRASDNPHGCRVNHGHPAQTKVGPKVWIQATSYTKSSPNKIM